MLIRYAEMARSEYVYLNLAFKFIVMLAPNCLDNRSVRLEVWYGKVVDYGMGMMHPNLTCSVLPRHLS